MKIYNSLCIVVVNALVVCITLFSTCDAFVSDYKAIRNAVAFKVYLPIGNELEEFLFPTILKLPSQQMVPQMKNENTFYQVNRGHFLFLPYAIYIYI